VGKTVPTVEWGAETGVDRKVAFGQRQHEGFTGLTSGRGQRCTPTTPTYEGQGRQV
jgi:hypothetical protein